MLEEKNTLLPSEHQSTAGDWYGVRNAQQARLDIG
jgi:hypothetical protein